MLALDDPRWTNLRQCYGTAERVPALLRRLLEQPDATTFDRLFELLYQQETVYPTSYAAVPYLARLLTNLPDTQRVMALILAGAVFSEADPSVQGIPEVRAGVEKAREELRPLVLKELDAKARNETAVRELLAVWAGLCGHRRLARTIQILDEEYACPFCGVVLVADSGSAD